MLSPSHHTWLSDSHLPFLYPSFPPFPHHWLAYSKTQTLLSSTDIFWLLSLVIRSWLYNRIIPNPVPQHAFSLAASLLCWPGSQWLQDLASLLLILGPEVLHTHTRSSSVFPFFHCLAFIPNKFHIILGQCLEMLFLYFNYMNRIHIQFRKSIKYWQK